MIGILFKINFETVFFKKLLIVRKMVRHTVIRLFKTFYKKSPPIVSVSKIDWTIHSFHAPSQQPFFACIEKQKCSFRVIYTFKKTHSATDILGGFGSFIIDKGRNLTNSIS